ncbi:hypothetical protein HWC53_gp200 [Bacillus phage vB_BmeM-Goe8]|uniref:Uncharacterized protein n=1 Tax=Bacillus phage vB_BmeM-Goe8 TaxID=2593638 RepID=A0A516KMR8_9CAUD|nr:hypothetical protein HWC53_gp200 [Bacillus phage vB_BmeM-Goe8]QDP42889.1 hypothetical protein Goe8_c01160 [Bacillus phage vB_BmeM-Goe8]
MGDNKLNEFIDNMLYFRKHKDDDGMLTLLEEGQSQHVTVTEAAETLVAIVDDLIAYIDTVQATDEVRLLTVIKSLPEDIYRKIEKEFNEDEDDLLKPEPEGENN